MTLYAKGIFMIHKRVGIIGCGNMGAALLERLSEGPHKASSLSVSDSDAGRRDLIQKKYNIIPRTDNNVVVKDSDVIILAVKPKDFKDVLSEARSGLSKDKVVISVAAGITTEFIEGMAGKGIPVIRAMPNMAAVIGESMTAVSAGRSAGPGDMKLAKEIFSAIGDVVEIEEGLMDSVTAIAGSGPAYFFYIIEALAAAAKELGLDEETAKHLVLKTALGSARLLEALKEEPACLRKRVTSKGGTTEAAIEIFEKKRLKSIIRDAARAACKRSKELSGRQPCSC